METRAKVPPLIQHIAACVTGGLLVCGMLLGSGSKLLKQPGVSVRTGVFRSSIMTGIYRTGYRALLTGAPAPVAMTMAPAAMTTVGTSVAPAANSPPSAKFVSYAIHEGDTLEAIAAKFGTTPDSIISANPDVRDTELQIGVTLQVPTFKGVLYTVQSGDTLGAIASLYSIGVDDIAKANLLADVHQLTIGQKLVLLGARYHPPAPAATATSAPQSSDGTERHYSSSYIWPLDGIITSEFGPRWGAFHTGLDIAASPGTPVAAAKAGTVEFAGWDGGYGKCVIINHGDGTKTRYAHASSILVDQGQWVEQGGAVIRVGNTGHSTGPHLHFEVMIDGTPRNPRNYLP